MLLREDLSHCMGFLYYVGLHSPTYELFPPQSETIHVLVVSLFVLTIFIDFIGLIVWKAW